MKKVFFTINLLFLLSLPILSQTNKTQVSIYGGLGRYQELSTINPYGIMTGLEYRHYVSSRFYLASMLHIGYVTGNNSTEFTGTDNKHYDIPQRGEVFNSMLGMGLGVDFLKIENKHHFYTQLVGGIGHYESDRTIIMSDRPTPDIYKYWGKQEKNNLNNFAFIGMLGYDYLVTNNLKIGITYTFFDIAFNRENSGLNLKLGYLF